MYVPFSQLGAKFGTLSNPQNHRGVVRLYFSEGIGGGPPYGKSLYIILRGYLWVTKIPKNLQRTPAKYHEYTVRGTPPYSPLVSLFQLKVSRSGKPAMRRNSLQRFSEESGFDGERANATVDF